MSRTVHAYRFRSVHSDRFRYKAEYMAQKHTHLDDKGEEPPDSMYLKMLPEPVEIPKTTNPKSGHSFKLRLKFRGNKLHFASCGG